MSEKQPTISDKNRLAPLSGKRKDWGNVVGAKVVVEMLKLGLDEGGEKSVG